MNEPGTAKIRVALVDDHAMIRQALSSVLADDAAFEVVAHGGDRSAAVRIANEIAPDVLVLDYNMPGGGAIAVLEDFARRQVRTRVLVLTVHAAFQYAVRVLEAGAQGFLAKESALEELRDAIREVHGGGIYITPSMSRQVIDQLRSPRSERSGLAALSTREFELLRLLGKGAGIKEAALQLKVSVSTASTYRARVMRKLDLASTSDLIRYALEHRVVE